MSRHTPGPWDLDDDTMEVFSSAIGQESGWIASVIGNDGNGRPLPKGEIAANARLIASAPDLLATLKAAADAIDYAQAQVDSENDRHNLLVRLVQVQRVIAKAEGRAE